MARLNNTPNMAAGKKGDDQIEHKLAVTRVGEHSLDDTHYLKAIDPYDGQHGPRLDGDRENLDIVSRKIQQTTCKDEMSCR